jgi:ATP-binding cassette subfamily B protein
MTKLAKYLKSSAGFVVLIVCLLFLQAHCELALPDYTSKIVNEGLQQQGIEDSVPEKMRAETAENLKLFLDEEQQAQLEDSYVLEDEVYVLKSLSDEERSALAETLTKAEIVLSAMTQESGISALMQAEDTDVSGDAQNSTSEDTDGADDTQNTTTETADAKSTSSSGFDFGSMQLPEGVSALDAMKLVPESMRAQIVSAIDEKISAIPETLTEQYAIQFVVSEYEALDVDMEKLQIGYIVKTGGSMLLLALLGMLASVAVTFCSARVAATVAHDLRNDVYRKVIGFTSEEFNHFSTASLITRSTNDIQQIQMLLAMGFRMVLYAPILGLGGVMKVVQSNASMSWIIALAVILIMLLIGVLFKVAMPHFTKLQTLIDRVNLVTREILSGIMVTRAFSAEKHEEERFEKANRDLTKTNLFVNRCMTFMMPAMMLIMNGVSVLIIYKGAYAIDGGTLQVGDMMAFIQYAMQIIMSFLMITMMSIMIPRANVAATRIYEVLSTETTIRDPEQPKTPDTSEKGTVEFDHVSFAYPDADEKVLEDISFRAERGQTVAFIGSTGSGKSTLINLIPRFYDVTEGSVKVDGVDVRDLTKKDLCDRLGYVPQKSILFTGTIDSNIRYGRQEASEEEVKAAAAVAQATDFIEAKDDQYDSAIAQGGTNVSGGQKQRLSIARAIAKQPEILIFDDSFSALDYKTDVALRRALKETTKDTTTLIVAQRISTILHADKIIVLDEGRVAGMGTHAELMKSCEVYRQIATSQLSEEELA